MNAKNQFKQKLFLRLCASAVKKLFKTIIHFSPAIVFLLAVSCNNPSGQLDIIPLEPTQNEKLDLGKPTQIIKLETTPESQLGYVNKTAFDTENNRIFVLSDFAVFIFDNNGKFISKLKKGKGPGEISMIISFSLNKQRQLFYALDNSNRICVFDYSGKMQNDYQLDGFYGKDIQVIDDNNVFLLSIKVYEQEPYFAGIYNFEKKQITQRFIPREESPYPELMMIVNNSFTSINKRQFLSTTNIFSLFEFKEGDFQKIISYDLGKRKVPESLIQKTMESGRRSRFGEEAQKNNYVPYLLNSFYYKGHFGVIIDDEERSCYAISEKNRNKVYLRGPVSSYFNLPNVYSFCLPKEINQDYLVFAGNPTDFFDENSTSEKTTIEMGNQKLEIELGENPFLVVVE
jgi:hypothetical protein